MERSAKRRKTTIERKHVESILFRMALFLSIGGVTKKDAQKQFISAYSRASKIATGRHIENVEYPIDHADIIGAWTRDKRFVDITGRPRLLSFRGKNSFSALVREVRPQADPSRVLSTLIRYGNVRRVKRNLYLLVRPFFSVCTPERMGFEPLTYFLADATETLQKIMTRTRRSKTPEDFWYKVEKTGLSGNLARKFLAFSRQRTLAFLEEMDVWLEANSETSRTNKSDKRRRVGLGIFSLYSKPDN